jgi:hypothetical protein
VAFDYRSLCALLLQLFPWLFKRRDECEKGQLNQHLARDLFCFAREGFSLGENLSPLVREKCLDISSLSTPTHASIPRAEVEMELDEEN